MRISETFKSLPAIKARQQIPPHKRKAQRRQTVVGVMVAAVAFLLRWKLDMPWVAVYIMAFFGGFIASKQLVLTFIKVIPEAIGALAGRTPNAPH